MMSEIGKLWGYREKDKWGTNYGTGEWRDGRLVETGEDALDVILDSEMAVAFGLSVSFYIDLLAFSYMSLWSKSSAKETVCELFSIMAVISSLSTYKFTSFSN